MGIIDILSNILDINIYLINIFISVPDNCFVFHNIPLRYDIILCDYELRWRIVLFWLLGESPTAHREIFSIFLF